MAISNGYDTSRVLAALMPRLGWIQPTEAGKNIVDSDNLTSDSGRCFNDGSFHNAVQVQNIISVMEDPKASSAQINDELRNMKKAAIMSALNGVFSKPRIIDRPAIMFDKAPNTELRAVPNASKFVGLQLNVAPGSFLVKLKTAALMFNADATFNLYLYHDLKDAPLWQKQVSVSANDQTIIDLKDEVLLSYLMGNNKGGVFYFGYFQDDIGAAQALDLNLTRWTTYRVMDYASFEAVVLSPLHFQKYRYTGNYRTYGLNLEVSSYYDYTQTIIDNADQLDELVGLQMAAQVIEKIVINTRSNQKDRILQEQSSALYTDLNAAIPVQGMPYATNMPVTAGLRNKINREIRTIANNFFPPKLVSSGCYE